VGAGHDEAWLARVDEKSGVNREVHAPFWSHGMSRGSPVCTGQARCTDAVRGCPCDWVARSPRARTYSGQRRHNEHYPVAFAQVRWYMEVQAGAYCKSVGSAYVGSNPTPATTSENGP
jgi:hypothetical protein